MIHWRRIRRALAGRKRYWLLPGVLFLALLLLLALLTEDPGNTSATYNLF